MLEDITELRTFVRIVNAGSLSAAGRELGVALSVVSKRLATLERRTDARLIARSTRRLALTEEGQQLYEYAQRILTEVDEAEAVLAHSRAEPKGVLRVSAPVALGRTHTGPVCHALVHAHPKLAIDLRLTDRPVELIDEGIDVAVRIAPPKDSGLIMRKLIDNHRVVVSSPAYLQRRGTPLEPKDLETYECLHYRGGGAVWHLQGPGGKAVQVQASSRLRTDNGELAQDWAIAGAGLILKSWVDVAADLHAGRLMRVLPEWHSNPAPVYALFPSGRQLPARARLFLDAMAARLKQLAD
jgi:DNA-binding transcriptional LysR family regulator